MSLDIKRPILLKDVPHIKQQTGRTCTGTLAYDPIHQEYSCLSCGWWIEAERVDAALLFNRFFGTELKFDSRQIPRETR